MLISKPRKLNPVRFTMCLVRSRFIVFVWFLLAHSSFGQSILSKNVFQKHQIKVEASVIKALNYLAETQQDNGTYTTAYGKSVGIVSLAGMAYLSAGHTPGFGEYAITIDRCIDYVLAGQQENGLIDRGGSGNGQMYAHTIATLFLSECSGMVEPDKQEQLEIVLAKATALILRAQAVQKAEADQGGWRYRADATDSDLSCSGWALMALRSAKLNGANIPEKAIQSAVAYVLRNHDPETGQFGYTSPHNNSNTLTGCGLLCLELCGLHGTQSTYRAGEFILRVKENILYQKHEFYGNYYSAQAMFQLGGEYWGKYADWMYQQYIPRQNKDGGWSEGKANKSDVYQTALMILSFTVPYRQLPIYQRDETVAEE